MSLKRRSRSSALPKQKLLDPMIDALIDNLTPDQASV